MQENMQKKSMTALISAFARAYHSETKAVKIFDDKIARLLFTDEEYSLISSSMTDGIGFFNPSFVGNKEEALMWIADNQLCPTVLSRSEFAESSLKLSVLIGARQYLVLGAGYDTFAYRQPEWGSSLQIFELDCGATINDKQKRLSDGNVEVPENVHYISADLAKDSLSCVLSQNKSFEFSKVTFCSMLGLTYYLTQNDFSNLLAQLNTVLSANSSIVFDYPTCNKAERTTKQSVLAEGANEKMLACYTYEEIEKMLSEHGFLIYEYMTPQEIEEKYFTKYNIANQPHSMHAFENVSFCLAVKKTITRE